MRGYHTSMVNLICFFISLVLNVVTSILSGVVHLLADFIVSPIRTTSRVLQTVASLGMVGAIVTVVVLKWKAPQYLDGMNWWQFAGAIALAFIVVMLTQWVLDRPTAAQRRAAKYQANESDRTDATSRDRLTRAERARLEELEAAEFERKKAQCQEAVDRLNRLSRARAQRLASQQESNHEE
ncbi:hypothetical protein PG2103B_1719 [Bifidobacterium pseudolongum subsp. globosum]|nr:hypothetical protein PG2103B_1719 [Bifidobacterium pseudolongum subsp. globosum]